MASFTKNISNPINEETFIKYKFVFDGLYFNFRNESENLLISYNIVDTLFNIRNYDYIEDNNVDDSTYIERNLSMVEVDNWLKNHFRKKKIEKVLEDE